MVENHEVVGPSNLQKLYGQMASIQLHISQNVAMYIDAQSHQPVLCPFPASCLSAHASWIHLQTTRALVDARQARE